MGSHTTGTSELQRSPTAISFQPGMFTLTAKAMIAFIPDRKLTTTPRYAPVDLSRTVITSECYCCPSATYSRSLCKIGPGQGKQNHANCQRPSLQDPHSPYCPLQARGPRCGTSSPSLFSLWGREIDRIQQCIGAIAPMLVD